MRCRRSEFSGVSLRRPDEAEGVAADVDVADRLRDLGHVAGDALAAGAARLVVGVLLDRRGVRPVRRARAVARQAKPLAGFRSMP